MMTPAVIELGTGNIRTAEDEEGDVFSGRIDVTFVDEVSLFFDLYVWDENMEFPRWLYVGAFNTHEDAYARGSSMVGCENVRIIEGSENEHD